MFKPVKKNRFDHLSVSTLAIECGYRLQCKLAGQPASTIPSDDALRGRDAHKEVEKLNPLSLLGIVDDGIWETMQEVFVEFEVGGYKFVSRPDIVLWHPSTGEAIVVDAKNRPSGDVFPSDRFQLKVYSLYLLKELQAQKVSTFVYFIPLKKLTAVDKFLAVDQVEIEEEVEERIKQTEKLMKEGKPRDGWDCKYCEYILDCPLLKYKGEDFKELIKKVWVMQNAIKQAKEVIKSKMQAEGVNMVEVDGIQAGWFPSFTIDIDPVDFTVTYMKSRGFHEADVMRPILEDLFNEGVIYVNKTTARKLARKNEDLTAYIEEKVGSVTFKVKNKGK